MFQIVAHRVNTLAELRQLPPSYGAEFDVRSRGSRLILHHEAFHEGEWLDPFLEFYASSGRQSLLIFNPKEDGLEAEILARVERHRIENFFLLDLAFPTMVRLAVKQGLRAIAARVSEYEPVEAALRFKGRVDWVWLDCFTGEPVDPQRLAPLRPHFKICAVSPELQGYPREAIFKFRRLDPYLDAVCTKHPEAWIL